MSDLIPDLVLQDNTSQRLPCVIIVDGSSSMNGKAIENLNAVLSSGIMATVSADQAADAVNTANSYKNA